MVDCLLLVGSELLPQVKKFTNLWALFTSEGTMDCEIDRLISIYSIAICEIIFSYLHSSPEWLFEDSVNCGYNISSW